MSYWICPLLLTLSVVLTSAALTTTDERLELARQYCLMQEDTDICDGFLCHQLFATSYAPGYLLELN